MTNKRRAARSRRRSLLLAALLVVGALSSLEAVRYVRAYRDLSAGRSLLLQADGLLTRQASPNIPAQTLDGAGTRLQSARARLMSAAGVLNDDPALALAGLLPWTGKQLTAARSLTEIGIHLSNAGLDAIAAVQQVQPLLNAPGSSLSEKVVPALQAIRPQVTKIEAEQAAVADNRDRIAASGLLPPLRSAVVQLDSRITTVVTLLRDYEQADQLASSLLGYQRPQTYLVLAHDNSEMLGGQGFVLIYGFLTLDKGQVKNLSFNNVFNVAKVWPPPSYEGYVLPPAPLDTYLLRGWPMGLAEASWWPDFPTEAQQAIQIYHANSKTNSPIDGVVGVDFFMLQKLLQVVGPIAMPQYGVTVTDENVIEETLLITNMQPRPPGETDNYAFAEELAKDVIQRALGVGKAQQAAMIAAVQSASVEKDLLLYSGTPSTEQTIASLGLDGRVKSALGDYLMAVDSSLGETKVSLAMQTSMHLDVRLDAEGNAADTLTIGYTLPYADWLKGKDPRLARLLYGPIPAYIDYLRVLVPSASRVTAASQDQQPRPLTDNWRNFGRQILARYFVLPLNTSTALSFTYTVPAAALSENGVMHYRLLAQKQPGIANVPLAVQIYPPTGTSVVSTSLDGTPLAASSTNGSGSAAPLRVNTDLSRDRNLDVAYAP